jgi:hypothetical protein
MTAVGRNYSWLHGQSMSALLECFRPRLASAMASASSTSMPRYRDGTFHFRVAKQKLDGTQVAGATVDQRCLRAAERVSAEDVCGSNPIPAIHFAMSRAY